MLHRPRVSELSCTIGRRRVASSRYSRRRWSSARSAERRARTSSRRSRPLAHPQLGWEANGPVNAVASRGDVAFVGGGFTHLGPPATGRSAVVAAASGVPRYGLPRVDGEVLAAAGDGAGGWFIGGRFQKVGGVTCPRLAHVRADLTVNPASARGRASSPGHGEPEPQQRPRRGAGAAAKRGRPLRRGDVPRLRASTPRTWPRGARTSRPSRPRTASCSPGTRVRSGATTGSSRPPRAPRATASPPASTRWPSAARASTSAVPSRR